MHRLWDSPTDQTKPDGPYTRENRKLSAAPRTSAPRHAGVAPRPVLRVPRHSGRHASAAMCTDENIYMCDFGVDWRIHRSATLGPPAYLSGRVGAPGPTLPGRAEFRGATKDQNGPRSNESLHTQTGT